MVTRRGALCTLGLSAVAVFVPRMALASVARAMSVKDLAEASRAVLLGEPVEAYSQWQTVGESKRIVTFTRVLVNETVLGNPESELMVRTLGGRVGKIGQLVHGEAALRLNEPSMLFLQDSAEGVTRVTAMAQGHYRLLADAHGIARLNLSPRLPTLLPNQTAAVDRLRDKTFPEAREIVLKALNP